MKKYISKFLIIIMLFMFSACIREDQNEDSYYQTGEVEWIVDGDTPHIIIDGEKQKVRFTGINTPEYNPKKEIKEHYGKEAFQYTKDMIKNKTITNRMLNTKKYLMNLKIMPKKIIRECGNDN